VKIDLPLWLGKRFLTFCLRKNVDGCVKDEWERWGWGVLQVLEVGEAERRAEVLTKVAPVNFGDGKKNVDNFWIELCAGAAANFLTGVGHG